MKPELSIVMPALNEAAGIEATLQPLHARGVGLLVSLFQWSRLATRLIVVVALVLVQRPRLLPADEPTSALDPAATTQVCHTLRALASEPGCTLITVVHDLDLLPLLANRVIGMAAGRVRWDRPIGEVNAPMLQDLHERRVGETAFSHEPEQAPVARQARA